MATSPLLSDLVGAVDNLDDPIPAWNHKSVIIGWTLAVQIVTLMCATARLYARFFVVRSPWWDDVFVVLVLLCSVIGSVNMGISTDHGMGQHLLLLSPSDITAYRELFYVGFGVFLMSGIFVKLALLFQYLRVFHDQPNLIRICRYLIVVTVVYGFIVTFLAWYETLALALSNPAPSDRWHGDPTNPLTLPKRFPCFPPAAIWQEAEPLPEDICFGFGSRRQAGLVATYVSTAVVNLFLDLCCLAVPVPLFFCRETTHKAKMGLTALLLLGGFVNGLALWRVVVSIATKVGTYPTYDPTWYAPISTMAAVFEVNASVVCASIPVFWPVLASKFGDILVTREVKVETSPRGEGGPPGCGDDEVQLWSPADADGRAAKKAYARAQVWPLVPLGTVESTVTAKHDEDRVASGTILVRPDAGKWV